MSDQDGYEVDPDAMRKAIDLTKRMLEELEERSSEVQSLMEITSPAEEPVTSGYTVGQGKTATGATGKYNEAFTAQATYLQQLLPRLEQALKQYEANEDAAASDMKSHDNELA